MKFYMTGFSFLKKIVLRLPSLPCRFPGFLLWLAIVLGVQERAWGWVNPSFATGTLAGWTVTTNNPSNLFPSTAVVVSPRCGARHQLGTIWRGNRPSASTRFFLVKVNAAQIYSGYEDSPKSSIGPKSPNQIQSPQQLLGSLLSSQRFWRRRPLFRGAKRQFRYLCIGTGVGRRDDYLFKKIQLV